MDHDMIGLLQLLYKSQMGCVEQNKFRIMRGVRQGDILSPLLFNAALEQALRDWKCKLTNEGIGLSPNEGRLTNIRYVDDLLLFAQSFDEAMGML